MYAHPHTHNPTCTHVHPHSPRELCVQVDLGQVHEGGDEAATGGAVGLAPEQLALRRLLLDVCVVHGAARLGYAVGGHGLRVLAVPVPGTWDEYGESGKDFVAGVCEGKERQALQRLAQNTHTTRMENVATGT